MPPQRDLQIRIGISIDVVLVACESKYAVGRGFNKRPYQVFALCQLTQGHAPFGNVTTNDDHAEVLSLSAG